MTQEVKTPLLEAIVADILNEVASLSHANSAQAFAYGSALSIVRQRFAALSEEEVARVIAGVSAEEWPRLLPETRAAVVRASKAQAVMQLLKKE